MAQWHNLNLSKIHTFDIFGYQSVLRYSRDSGSARRAATRMRGTRSN